MRETQVIYRVNAGTHAGVPVERRQQHLGHAVGMFGLAADGGAVFSVECHIEYRPEFALQLQALAHARLDAAVVVAHR